MEIENKQRCYLVMEVGWFLVNDPIQFEFIEFYGLR